MSRLGRFEDYRFIGTRDTMIVYDCESPEQFSELEQRAANEHLLARTLLQSFSPDTLDEARNRGFKPSETAAVSDL